MTFLRAAIDRMNAMGSAGLAKPPTTQPELQRQLAKFDASVGEPERAADLKPFLSSVAVSGAEALPRFQLNRVLRGAWCDPKFDNLGAAALERAEKEQRRSSDQAVIEGYLSYFPANRPIIGKLANAAANAALRHKWAWRDRAIRWEMFKPAEGPHSVARDLVARDEHGILQLMRETGLGTNLAASGFGQATFAGFCVATAQLSAAKAVPAQRSLMRLFDKKALAGQLDLVVRALLEPWIDQKPDPEHRKAISAVLLDQVGDPRLERTRWDRIVRALAESIGQNRAITVTQVFKRWLTEVAMREFFGAIAKTTDRPDQWAQREKFWLAYLDAGFVSDAWPALGIRARNEIEDIIRKSGERPEFGTIRGGPPSSSSIIMQIGDLRISEWSDNGMCRFWAGSDSKAPGLYQKSYDGSSLRVMAGRSDFEHAMHSSGWQAKFAAIIFRRTSIPHPKIGKSADRNWDSRW